MSDPTLAALHIYPVKSLAGTARDEVTVEPWGPAGDRRWLLASPEGRTMTQREHPRLALASPELLPDGGLRVSAPGMEPLDIAVPGAEQSPVVVEVWQSRVESVRAGAAADAWFSAYLGTGVQLVHLAAPERNRPVQPAYSRPGETVSFADGFPLLLTTVSSLDALNSLIAQGDHPDEGPLGMDRFRPNAVVRGTAPWAEDRWRRVRIGQVTFRVVKPCGRCVVTTTDQRTGERGKEPLRTLARHRRSGGDLVFGQNLIPEHTGRVRSGDSFEVLDGEP